MCTKLSSGSVKPRNVREPLVSLLFNKRTILLPVVLYGCETWILREEHRLRVYENRVLRRIFKPKRDEVTGG
jgi:hypothetical protein